MKKHPPIRIETLQLIRDPQTFFETDKILSVDIFDIGEMPISPLEKIKLKSSGQSFEHAGRTYTPIFLIGSPENLFLNTKNGIPWKIGDLDVQVYFDGKLIDLLQKNKVYDISHCYKKGGIAFWAEPSFLIYRYILPYANGNSNPGRAKVILPANALTRENLNTITI